MLTTSERWLYETQLLERLQACEPAGADQELFEALTQSKQQQLPRLRYNALLGGPEWRALISVQALAGEGDLASAQTASLEQALDSLLRLDGQNERQLYEPLQTLRFSNAGGELRRTWRRQTLVLTCLLYTSPSPRDRG